MSFMDLLVWYQMHITIDLQSFVSLLYNTMSHNYYLDVFKVLQTRVFMFFRYESKPQIHLISKTHFRAIQLHPTADGHPSETRKNLDPERKGHC